MTALLGPARVRHACRALLRHREPQKCVGTPHCLTKSKGGANKEAPDPECRPRLLCQQREAWSRVFTLSHKGESRREGPPIRRYAGGGPVRQRGRIVQGRFASGLGR
jgi:hypothetical protein